MSGKRIMRLLVPALLMVLVLASCSSKKNTPMTRKIQAFKARYNTYYNGHQAYLEGISAQHEGNKDNFTELIPVFMIENKSTAALGTSNFERAAEKCQKTIRQHSITAKPKRNSNKARTPKEKQWLAQKEYNPFLHKAWMLLGQAQLRKGDYMEAASTFAYIQRLYATKPNIVAKARLLEAQSYAAMDWIYDAENLLNAVRRDSMPTKLAPLKAAVQADCDIRQQHFDEAIPNVQQALKGAKGTLEKARLHFLLGQLYRQVGNRQMAFKEFKKVVRLNPPYDLAFNARIQQTEVLSKGQSKKMIGKLKSMARNPKNKEYLDQVYYAIGNIYLAQGDTTRAIWAYKDGVEKSTRNGVEKGVVWLHLGQLYWDREEFVKAQECYSGALGLFDKDRPDYKEIDERAKILEELLPYAKAVELQDSLQELARMDSAERIKVIDRLIAEYKKKEKEDARKNAATTQSTTQAAASAGAQGAANAGLQSKQGAGVWYFYNPTAVAAGKQEFQKKWGQRVLEDNWRRSNRTVLGSDDEETEADTLQTAENGGEAAPATGKDGEELSEKEQKELKKQQERENDPHEREYYLKDIPLTDEQMIASNAALVDGLYNSGIIYKDRMENFPLAERTFQRILTDFPDFEHIDETYYNLFQLYSRTGMASEAANYRALLVSSYPDNEHAKLVADPNFEYKGRYGTQIEDSLYQQAYDAFQRGDYSTVLRNEQYTAREYPDGKNRARFLFLASLSRLERGERDQFLSSMRGIVDKYPQSTVSELAGLYVKGLKEGRILASGHMTTGNAWSRRSGMYFEPEDTASIDTTFTKDRNLPFVFVVAYEHDSINENQLLYEIARFNFSSFSVRYFDMSIVPGDGIDMLQVKSFQNYDEAYIYLHLLYNNEDMAYKLEGLKTFIISEKNLALLMKGRSFEDYFQFYDQHFDKVARAKAKVDESTLDEPTELPSSEDFEEQIFEPEVEGEDDEDDEEYDDEDDEEEDYIF